MNLSIRGVTVDIQSSRILRGVNLEVGHSELVCLIGRNGAGKTTLMRTIMGYHKLINGSIEIDGRSIAGLPTHKIADAGIGFSPEESEVFATLSVASNIELPTWTRKTARSVQERLDLAYSIFPTLRAFSARGGGQLSGGQRKMLSIARALALDADMLLLDEPFEGLSPAIIPTINDGIRQIVASGRSVLQAESSLHHVPKFAKHLYVLERGEIVFSGTPEDAYQQPEVRRIIGADL